MRKLFAFLSLLCLTAGAQVQTPTVIFKWQDITTQPSGIRLMWLYPTQVTPTNGGFSIQGNRITVVTGTNATVTVTNLLPGKYRAEFFGPFDTSTNWFLFPNTNGVINAADWPDFSQTYPGTWIPAFSTTESDLRYQRSGNATVTSTNILTPNNVMYPAYGVKGDGTTDDSSALQTAINAIGVNGTVYFPQLQFRVASSINGLSGQQWVGNGPGTIITMTGTNAAIVFAHATNASLYGLTVTCNTNTTTGETNYTDVLFMFCTNSVIEKCSLKSFGLSGALLLDCEYCTVRNNYVEGLFPTVNDFSAHIYLLGGGRGNKVTGNIVVNGATGIAIQSSVTDGGTGVATNNLVSLNTVANMTRYGIIDYVGGFAQCSNVANEISFNTIQNITGASVSSGTHPYGAGIYLQGSDGDSVTVNTISRCNLLTDIATLAPGGIGLNGVNSATLTGNNIADCSYPGIYVVHSSTVTAPGGQLQILGGSIVRCPDGIDLLDHGNTLISGVSLFYNTNNNILVNAIPTEPCTNITVTGCTISSANNAAGLGIHAYANNGLVIKGNTISVPDAIYLEATTTNASIVNNYLHNAAYGVVVNTNASARVSLNKFDSLIAGVVPVSLSGPPPAGVTMTTDNEFFNAAQDFGTVYTVANNITSQWYQSAYDSSNSFTISSSGTNTATGSFGTKLILKNGNSTAFNAGSEILFADNALNGVPFASIEAPSANTSGWGYLDFLTKFTGTDTTILRRMRIDNSGNVGIGTTTNSLTNLFTLQANGRLLSFDAADAINSQPTIDTVTSRPLQIRTAGITRMIIGNSGSVGIGTNTPNATLEVNGTLQADGQVTSGSAFAVNSTVGITTNLNVLIPGSKTNQLQFVGGILTGVIAQ